jgi:DNA topoisomerase-1
LPSKNLGVDIENGFAPEYEVTQEKVKTVDSLKKLARTHPSIWIATDEDRE